MNEVELKCFQMISEAGVARSNFIEAITEIKKRNYEQAEKLIKEAEKNYIQGHASHMELLQMDTNIDTVNSMVLLMHAEDQLMSVEVFKTLFNELKSVYERIEKIEEVTK